MPKCIIFFINLQQLESHVFRVELIRTPKQLRNMFSKCMEESCNEVTGIENVPRVKLKFTNVPKNCLKIQINEMSGFVSVYEMVRMRKSLQRKLIGNASLVFCPQHSSARSQLRGVLLLYSAGLYNITIPISCQNQ